MDKTTIALVTLTPGLRLEVLRGSVPLHLARGNRVEVVAVAQVAPRSTLGRGTSPSVRVTLRDSWGRQSTLYAQSSEVDEAGFSLTDDHRMALHSVRVRAWKGV